MTLLNKVIELDIEMEDRKPSDWALWFGVIPKNQPLLEVVV